MLAGPVAPWEGPHTGAEEREEEGAAETTRDELTATPAPCPLRCLGGGGGEVRSEDEPRKKERGGGKVFFRFVLISHYPNPPQFPSIRLPVPIFLMLAYVS